MVQVKKIDSYLASFNKLTELVEGYAFIVLDIDGTILSWNKGAEKIKGYTASEIIGQHFSIFYLPQDRQNNLPEKLLNEAKVKGAATYLGRRIRKNGTIFWGKVELSAIKDDDGNIIGFAKIARELKDEIPIGQFWFDNEGVLHTKSSSEPHTPESIAEFRSIINQTMGGQKVCCVADIRDAVLQEVEASFSQPAVADIYKAIAFVTNKPVDINTRSVVQWLPSSIPVKTVHSREEGVRWIKQYL